jgi:hypothetical protein
MVDVASCPMSHGVVVPEVQGKAKALRLTAVGRSLRGKQITFNMTRVVASSFMLKKELE